MHLGKRTSGPMRIVLLHVLGDFFNVSVRYSSELRENGRFEAETPYCMSGRSKINVSRTENSHSALEQEGNA